MSWHNRREKSKVFVWNLHKSQHLTICANPNLSQPKEILESPYQEWAKTPSTRQSPFSNLLKKSIPNSSATPNSICSTKTSLVAKWHLAPKKRSTVKNNQYLKTRFSVTILASFPPEKSLKSSGTGSRKEIYFWDWSKPDSKYQMKPWRAKSSGNCAILCLILRERPIRISSKARLWEKILCWIKKSRRSTIIWSSKSTL